MRVASELNTKIIQFSHFRFKNDLGQPAVTVEKPRSVTISNNTSKMALSILFFIAHLTGLPVY